MLPDEWRLVEMDQSCGRCTLCLPLESQINLSANPAFRYEVGYSVVQSSTHSSLSMDTHFAYQRV